MSDATFTTVRHDKVFSAHRFGDLRVDVIGAGATGSRVLLELARLGIQNIHAWDFDTVSEENLANQAFALRHVGMPKVDAAAELVREHTGAEITTHNEAVDGSQRLGDIVFMLPDTMEARETIFKKAIRLKPWVKLLIETRMGTFESRIYTIDPRKIKQVKGYEATLYDDAEAEASACGTAITVGATAGTLASMATMNLIRWFRLQENPDLDDELEHELLMFHAPLSIIDRSFT